MAIKFIDVEPETLVFDIRKGVVTAKKLINDKYTTYNEWGEIGQGKVSKINVKPEEICVTISPTFMITTLESAKKLDGYGENKIGQVWTPSRKWRIFRNEMEDYEIEFRNMLAEHLNNTSRSLELTFDEDEIDDFLKVQALLPFYGIMTSVKPNEGIIEVDPGGPPCFFMKMLPMQENMLIEIVKDWQFGGWFRTLKPVDENYVDEVLKIGIFFEGFKGIEMLLPFKATNHGIEKEAMIEEFGDYVPMVRIEVPEQLRIDLGKFMI